MVTFTLPCELRTVTYRNQRTVYSLMFSCVSSTLKDFGLTPKHLGAEIGMTMVLHTHNRRLDFHPHIHVVVPGGGIDKRRRQWKKKKGKYLFNQKALAKVFRAHFLDSLNKAGLPIPMGIRPEWVVDCTRDKASPRWSIYAVICTGAWSVKKILLPITRAGWCSNTLKVKPEKRATELSKEKISYALSCSMFYPKDFEGWGITDFFTAMPGNCCFWFSLFCMFGSKKWYCVQDRFLNAPAVNQRCTSSVFDRLDLDRGSMNFGKSQIFILTGGE